MSLWSHYIQLIYADRTLVRNQLICPPRLSPRATTERSKAIKGQGSAFRLPEDPPSVWWSHGSFLILFCFMVLGWVALLGHNLPTQYIIRYQRIGPSNDKPLRLWTKIKLYFMVLRANPRTQACQASSESYPKPSFLFNSLFPKEKVLFWSGVSKRLPNHHRWLLLLLVCPPEVDDKSWLHFRHRAQRPWTGTDLNASSEDKLWHNDLKGAVLAHISYQWPTTLSLD